MELSVWYFSPNAVIGLLTWTPFCVSSKVSVTVNNMQHPVWSHWSYLTTVNNYPAAVLNSYCVCSKVSNAILVFHKIDMNRPQILTHYKGSLLSAQSHQKSQQNHISWCGAGSLVMRCSGCWLWKKAPLVLLHIWQGMVVWIWMLQYI